MTRFKLWLVVIAGVLVLGAMYVLFRPEAPVVPATVPDAPAPATPAPGIPPGQSQFEFTLQGGKPVAAPSTMAVKQGDVVVIRVTSDRADELHLHGYDMHVPLKPGEPAQLLFTADRTGRFELELHTSHVELGALEVQPADR